MNLTWAPSCFNKETTATASVDDRTDPIVNASLQLSYEYPNITFKTKARIAIPHKIPGIAKIMILVNDFLKTYQSQLNPSSNRSTGMKIKRIKWGSIFEIIVAPPPT